MKVLPEEPRPYQDITLEEALLVRRKRNQETRRRHERTMRRLQLYRRAVALLPIGAIALIAIIGLGAAKYLGWPGGSRFADPAGPSRWSAETTLRHHQARRNCDSARAVGLAPARRGEPGYWPHLDADDDGVSCEPWPSRGSRQW
jgi:hypothetical protein